MYEKPQYLTPDGYRRSSSNPLNSKKLALKASLDNIEAQRKLLLARKTINKKPGISDEAAKLIAEALKSMLHQK